MNEKKINDPIIEMADRIADLTSERDEAVRVATEAQERAAAADWLHGALLLDDMCTETAGLADEFLRRMMRIDNGETPNRDAVRERDELRAKAALADELLSNDEAQLYAEQHEAWDDIYVEYCRHCTASQSGEDCYRRPFPHEPRCAKVRYDSLTTDKAAQG